MNKKFITAKNMASITGSLNFQLRAIWIGKPMMRTMFTLLQTKKSWASRIWISQELRDEWKWWILTLQRWEGSDPNRMAKETQVVITTDASEWGWGAWMVHNETVQSTFGRFSQEVAHQSSNYRELTGIIMALLAFKEMIRNSVILIQSDNTTSISCVNKLRSPSEMLNDLTVFLVGLCQQLQITLKAIHIAGVENDLADFLSRFMETGDWATSWEAFHMLDQRWGPHTIDRFASWANHKVPRYNSAVLDSQAERVDAFRAGSWRTHPLQERWLENNFINPPFHLLFDVVNKIIRDQARATLIIPKWEQHEWYQMALQNAYDIIELSSLQDLFLPGLYGNTRPVGNHKWQVLACRFFWN
jgi:hypothetical protein